VQLTAVVARDCLFESPARTAHVDQRAWLHARRQELQRLRGGIGADFAMVG
jgi:hypothetical protein